jgi:hypothetical protein
LEALTEATRLSNGNSKPTAMAAYILGRAGRPGEALELLAALRRLSEQRYIPPMALALAYAGLRDDERVFEWLEKAAAVRDTHLIYVIVDPKWDPYRRDRRFQRVLRTSGLDEEG